MSAVASRLDLTFPSGDGECAAWWYEPGGDERSGCVVMGHGFTATRHEGLDLYAREFAAAGLAVLVFDYRHFGDSPGEPRQRMRVRRELEDWRSALAFARGRPEVDPGRLAAWGYSLGGGLVAETAARGEHLAAALLSFPFLDGTSRSRGLPLRERVWVIGPALLDLLGRPTYVPVTGPPGSQSVFNRPSEQEGLSRVARQESPFRNEVSAGCLVSIGFFKPLGKAAKVRLPTWVGVGQRDISVDGSDTERFAELAPDAELHRYPFDHFEPLLPDGARRVAADQIDFLRRRGVLSTG
jgi:alpha-beta hydrolase superfamily lysophospholipase